MKYQRKDYENFFNQELETQMKEYERLVTTKAITLKERGEVFVGAFIKLQENGIAIFKVRVNDNMPRKNSFWTASHFIGVMGKFKNWEQNSWAELRDKYQKDFSDAHCVWLSKSKEDSGFCLIGIKNLSLEFAKTLEEEKPIVAFGPKDPPLKYLLNLIDIVSDNKCSTTKAMLDFDVIGSNQWQPSVIKSNADFSDILFEQMGNSDCIIVQGPPGTGKTYRMAQFTSKLLKQNKSVLVTALTNQALMELVLKDDLKPFLDRGKVTKTSLTVDESRELPQLQANKDNVCNAAKGYLSLATFYISSGWGKDASDVPFDYVIMDEASQAFLPMIAAVLKLGKKVIWIGDQYQLSPIVMTNEDIINRFEWGGIIKGFNTLCENFNHKSYMLSDTYRLTQRGAECTGIFYNNELQSVAEHSFKATSIDVFNKNGGPSFLGLELKAGSKTPQNAIDEACSLATLILQKEPNARIAVLSKFRETVRQLQKSYILSSPNAELPENVKIETVDRVQGLTVDYTIFLIPNASLQYSLDQELFNVATSRARFCSLVIADKHILHNNMSDKVRRYFLKMQEDKMIVLEDKQFLTSGNIGLTIKGKIDLSLFERPRKEIDKNKENIYIIDTNVFVDCPNIIFRIGKNYKIVIPSKVLEELDKLKLNKNVDKKTLNEAAKNINNAFVNKFSSMEDADVGLLPSGFDRFNPDCMILSVALKYKSQNQNPILLTSDNMLQGRSSALGITTISLKDFLRK